jgi:hypothetical protein
MMQGQENIWNNQLSEHLRWEVDDKEYFYKAMIIQEKMNYEIFWIFGMNREKNAILAERIVRLYRRYESD